MRGGLGPYNPPREGYGYSVFSGTTQVWVYKSNVWMTSWWYYWGHADVICWMSNTTDCVHYFSKLWGESRESSNERVEKATLGFSIFLDGLQGVWKCGEI